MGVRYAATGDELCCSLCTFQKKVLLERKSQKDKSHGLPFLCGAQSHQIHRDRKQKEADARGWGGDKAVGVGYEGRVMLEKDYGDGCMTRSRCLQSTEHF